MNLIDITEELNTEEKCLAFLEKMRWPDGVIRCPVCGDKRITKFERKGKTGKIQHLYRCLEKTCDYQFAVTTGTIFHDSHLPLTKWFIAIALLTDAKKSISANQLSRHIGVQYKTAWHLTHRIREAMKTENPIKLSGVVEADETFVGGHYDKRRKRASYEKPCVVGVIQRGGSVRAQQIPSRGARAIAGFLQANVEPGSQLMTDDYAGYQKVGKQYEHKTVQHSKLEYVAGLTHTNSIENFWSLFKRGVIGSFHKVSIKHLDRYLGEFTYRQNNRKEPDIFGMTVDRLLRGKALQYEALVGNQII